MKKLLLIIALFSALLLAPKIGLSDGQVQDIGSRGGVLSATDTAAELRINRNHLILVNDGSDTVYFRLNDSADADASTDFSLAANESVTLDATPGKQFYNVQYICANSDTASVRYLAWD